MWIWFCQHHAITPNHFVVVVDGEVLEGIYRHEDGPHVCVDLGDGSGSGSGSGNGSGSGSGSGSGVRGEALMQMCMAGQGLRTSTTSSTNQTMMRKVKLGSLTLSLK